MLEPVIFSRLCVRPPPLCPLRLRADVAVVTEGVFMCVCVRTEVPELPPHAQSRWGEIGTGGAKEKKEIVPPLFFSFLPPPLDPPLSLCLHRESLNW